MQAIVDDEYRVPEGGDLDVLTSAVEAHLGSTDAFLRETGLEILWQWGQEGRYSDEQLIALGDRMVANVAIGLGESGTDTVFLRAFSALVLAMVVLVDQRCDAGLLEDRSAFVGRERTLDWFERTLACFVAERDRRGLVPDGKGWAHAIAHLADVLSDFAKSPHLGAEHLERLLDAVAAKMIEPADLVHCFYEDERVTQMVIDVLRRDIVPMAWLRGWLNTLAHTQDGGHWADVFGLEGCDVRANHARANTRDFLRSLYFQLRIGPRNFRSGYLPEHYARPVGVRDDLLEAIVEALKAMDKYFYLKDETAD